MSLGSLAAKLRDEGFSCTVMNAGWVETDMGGIQVPLHASESIGGMRKVIDRLTPADSGKFLTYERIHAPW